MIYWDTLSLLATYLDNPPPLNAAVVSLVSLHQTVITTFRAIAQPYFRIPMLWLCRLRQNGRRLSDTSRPLVVGMRPKEYIGFKLSGSSHDIRKTQFPKF